LENSIKIQIKKSFPKGSFFLCAPPRSSTPRNVAIESNFEGFFGNRVEAPRTGYIFMNRLSLWRVFGVLGSISGALGGWVK